MKLQPKPRLSPKAEALLRKLDTKAKVANAKSQLPAAPSAKGMLLSPEKLDALMSKKTLGRKR